jgi:4-amino-4-deoxy-L-arabinose transferase-like glycosyltransferase
VAAHRIPNLVREVRREAGVKREILQKMLSAMPPKISLGLEEQDLNTRKARGQPENSGSMLFGVIALALGLRVWGIGFGLPYEFTYDEVHEILRAFKLGAGEYQWSFGKGGLYLILFVEYGLIFVVSWMLGWVANARDFAIWYVLDPSVFFLAGRLTVALMGALTCMVVYGIGARIWDWRVGLAAGFIGAAAGFHAAHSHVINVDVGTTLALWASIMVYLRYEEKKETRQLIGAGILAAIAIAFKLPGGIVLLTLLVAIASNAETLSFRTKFREAGVLLLTAAATLTLIAPEWLTSLGDIQGNFSQLAGSGASSADADGQDLRDSIDAVTILRGDWSWYILILLKNHNFALTLATLAGAGLAFWRRSRWPIIWILHTVVFLAVMFAADRGPSERYLLPVVPGLWLLSAWAIVEISRRRAWLMASGLACVVAAPLFLLVRQNYEWTNPDTREVAKVWIEANVPPGSKILMDGMRYRFVQSPPLRPDQATVARLAAQAGGESEDISRTGVQSYLPGEAGWAGASRTTWLLYAEAMQRAKGPSYALYSTLYGLGVEDLDHYIQACFDYIITSSYNTKRYISDPYRARFPKSARFYDGLKTDSRFRVVYSVAPIAWRRPGPAITVYQVPPCRTSTKRLGDS